MVLEERIRSPITRSNTSIASSAATCGITAANATRVARRRFPARSETAWARAARAKRTSAWSRPGHRHLVAAGQGGEVGVGLLDGFGVRLVLGVLGQRPVDAGDGGVLSLALAGGDDQVRLDLLDGLPERPAPQHGVQHVVGDDLRPAAVLALEGRGIEPFQRRLADVLRPRGTSVQRLALRTIMVG
ncbi:hypothetical protein ACFXKS_39350 [Streptomyces scopuliridis]|uniref:hypothetical protein n=1 Tax=Streptomyces scopuliridis TaxID=452529 RepID=UPI0036CFDCBA